MARRVSHRRTRRRSKARTSGATRQELDDEDFQFVLNELLAATSRSSRRRSSGARSRSAEEGRAAHPPSCEDELQLAERIFERFCTEKVALRLLPPEAREQLGSVEQVAVVPRHIRCCIMFGWLVCRGPRTFRAYVYYLYRYWLCVRQALGDAPIGRRSPTKSGTTSRRS